MPTLAHSYFTAGVALVGASVISATPIAPSQPESRSASWDVSLAAAAQTCAEGDTSALCSEPTELPYAAPFATTSDGSELFNIPANLFIALANTPFNFFTALGEGNVQLGSDPEGDFSFQPTYEGVTLTQPEGSVPGLGRNLRYTGSWWLYSQTNILGTDPADPSRYQAITNILIPFPALAVPLGNIFAAIAASQLPMHTGCTGTGPGACDDPVGILSKMFDLRHVAALFSPEGYTYPETRAGITCDEAGQCYVKDEDGPEVPWSGQTVKLDATEPFTSFYNSLTVTPDVSSIKPVTPELVTGSLVSLGTGLNTAFNPFVLGTQCAICAPFVPNPDNEPVPGPVFEDPDATESVTAAAPETVENSESVQTTGTDAATTQLSSAPDPTAPDTDADTADVADTAAEAEADAEAEESTKTGPKHRKPSAASETVKQVRSSISSTISKVTDGFKKPGSKAGQSDDSPAGKGSDSASDSQKSGSDSGSDD